MQCAHFFYDDFNREELESEFLTQRLSKDNMYQCTYKKSCFTKEFNARIKNHVLQKNLLAIDLAACKHPPYVFLSQLVPCISLKQPYSRNHDNRASDAH